MASSNAALANSILFEDTDDLYSNIERKYIDGDNWNERFQYAISLPEETFQERLCKYSLLNSVNQDFLITAETYAKTIISEYFLPKEHKSVRVEALGGVAGGKKYLWRGILFKLADGGTGPYEGSDEAAAKAIGHDLRGATHFFKCGVRGLCTALQAVIDFKGFRVCAQAFLPVSAATLKIGTADGGRTLHYEDRDLLGKLRRAARRLNLKGHAVGRGGRRLWTGADVEGHRGRDGRAYLIDFARAFPPECPRAAAHLAPDQVGYNVGQHAFLRDGRVAAPDGQKRDNAAGRHDLVPVQIKEILADDEYLVAREAPTQGGGGGEPVEAVRATALVPAGMSIFWRMLRPEYVRHGGRRIFQDVEHRQVGLSSPLRDTPLQQLAAGSHEGSSRGSAASFVSLEEKMEMGTTAGGIESNGRNSISPPWNSTRPPTNVPSLKVFRSSMSGSAKFGGHLIPESIDIIKQTRSSTLLDSELEEENLTSAEVSPMPSPKLQSEPMRNEDVLVSDDRSRSTTGGSFDGYRYYAEHDHQGIIASSSQRSESKETENYSYSGYYYFDSQPPGCERRQSLWWDSAGGAHLFGLPAEEQEEEDVPPHEDGDGEGKGGRREAAAAAAAGQRGRRSAGPPPLSSDALSLFGEGDPLAAVHNQEVSAATRHLLREVVPAVAYELLCLSAESFRALELAEFLHRHGVNCRHMGLLRQAAGDPALWGADDGGGAGPARRRRRRRHLRRRLLLEVVARTLKQLLRGAQRRLLRGHRGTGGAGGGSSEQSLKALVARFFNLVTGAHPGAGAFWEGAVTPGLVRRFGAVALSPEERRNGLRDACQEDEAFLKALINRLSEVTGVKFHPTAMDQFNERFPRAAGFEFLASDVWCLEPVVKAMHMVDFSEGMLLSLLAERRQAQQAPGGGGDGGGGGGRGRGEEWGYTVNRLGALAYDRFARAAQSGGARWSGTSSR